MLWVAWPKSLRRSGRPGGSEMTLRPHNAMRACASSGVRPSGEVSRAAKTSATRRLYKGKEAMLNSVRNPALRKAGFLTQSGTGGSGSAVSRGCPPRRGSGGGWLARY